MWQKKFQKNSFFREILQIFFRKREYCDKILPFFTLCQNFTQKKMLVPTSLQEWWRTFNAFNTTHFIIMSVYAFLPIWLILHSFYIHNVAIIHAISNYVYVGIWNDDLKFLHDFHFLIIITHKLYSKSMRILNCKDLYWKIL